MGCSGKTAHRRLRWWEELGIWDRLHADLLHLLRQADKLDSDIVIVDGVYVRAFGGGQQTGPSPVDRRKKGSKHTLLVDKHGVPLAIRIAGANASDHTQIIPLVADFPAVSWGVSFLFTLWNSRRTSAPVVTSYSRTEPSLTPMATCVPSGAITTASRCSLGSNGPGFSSTCRKHFPVLASHQYKPFRASDEMMVFPSGEKAMLVTRYR